MNDRLGIEFEVGIDWEIKNRAREVNNWVLIGQNRSESAQEALNRLRTYVPGPKIVEPAPTRVTRNLLRKLISWTLTPPVSEFQFGPSSFQDPQISPKIRTLMLFSAFLLSLTSSSPVLSICI